MSDTDGLRYTRIPLNNGFDEIPALGFGTLIPDPIATKEATRAALEVGFRQFDTAERYRNEEQVGEAMRGSSGRARSSATKFLSVPSCGTRIIVPNASNPPSRQV